MTLRSSLVVRLVLVILASFAASPANAQNIVAHRGASFDAPENTVAAMELAFEQGADGVEADFYLSSDGEIVCIHDKDTQRTAGVKHVIVETPLAELRKLDVGSWKDEKYRGERIPTFAEIAETIPDGKKFIIELKVGPEIVAPLKEALAKTDLKDEQILIICFNENTVAECKKVLPNLKCHWLTGYKQDENTGEWKPTLAEVVATLERSQADGLGTQGDEARRRGVHRGPLRRGALRVPRLDDRQAKGRAVLSEAEAVGDHDQSSGVHSREVETEAGEGPCRGC